MVNLLTSKFFFSGDIYLSPKNSLEVDETRLTKTQLLDIIEAHTLGTLTVSDIDNIKIQYNTLTSFNRAEIETQLGNLKDKVENLEVNPTVSDKYLGVFTTSESIPLDQVGPGSYADVDPGVGFDIERWIYDPTDNIFIKTSAKSLDIAQEQGQSEIKVVSQKLFTDTIGNIEEVLNYINGETPL